MRAQCKGSPYGRPVGRGVWTAKTVKRPRQQPAHPQYANYWAPLTRKRHTMPHSAQPQHTNYWAPRTRKRHSQSTGRSGRQKVATRRNMRREERVTVQGPVKEQQPDGMSHRGGQQAKAWPLLERVVPCGTQCASAPKGPFPRRGAFLTILRFPMPSPLPPGCPQLPC